MTKVWAPDFFNPKRVIAGFTDERTKYLKENIGIDPAMLADELGLKLVLL
jgi:hypothetical protein